MMTKEEFHKLWASIYPETVLISHFFRHDYPDRWFRIHSLPKSKRYADSDEEWKILLTRQNEIIMDLFGFGTSILLVTGDWEAEKATHLTEQEKVLKSYSFTRLDNIDLYKLDTDYYDEGQIYRPAFAETLWKSNQHNELLREIANDNMSAFFVSFDKNVIVAPYDGGVDFVLKDNSTKDFYKNKYKQWLSELESGL
jgi:hypothetical protein